MYNEVVPPVPIRVQLLVALVIPAALVVGGVALWSHIESNRALDHALGQKLIAVAQAAANLTNPRVVALEPGDEDSRTHRSLVNRLLKLQKVTDAARILIIDVTENHIIVDTQKQLRIGTPYVRALFDRPELEKIANGQGSASVLFEGPNGKPFKTGYAPLFAEDDDIVAYAAVSAPATYTAALDNLSHRMTLIGGAGVLLLTILAFLIARLLTIPISRLSDSAKSIAQGRLDTEIPAGGLTTETRVLAQTMHSMTKSLCARDEELQLMLGGIAHEVRNPLGGLKLFGGLLYEDLEGDPRQKHVNKILKEIEVLACVVNEFLDFARRKPLELSKTDLGQLIEDSLAMVRPQSEARDITIKVLLAAELKTRVDRNLIHAAILNLVQNAVQAVDEGGQVAIEAQVDGSSIVICIDDSGVGIPKDKRERVFTPFFTTKQKGTGLGLALVKKAINDHQGLVWIEDSLLGGARFVIKLPLWQTS